MATPTSETKVCKRCSIEKSVNEFRLRKPLTQLRSECKTCQDKVAAAYREANRERLRENARKYRDKNLDKCRASCRAAYARNQTKRRAYRKEYCVANKQTVNAKQREYHKANREQILLKMKAYQAVNKERIAAISRKYRTGPGKPIRKALNAARRAKKKQALLPWVDRKAISDIYANCPEGYHVDHIIAINSSIVTGLHVPWNLQYLPASENISKGNKLPPKEQWLAHVEEQKD